jgi:hypothetical protein
MIAEGLNHSPIDFLLVRALVIQAISDFVIW